MAVHPRVSLLTATAVAIAVLAAVPVASVGFNLFAGGTSATWAHLAQTVLADYVQNSLLLCLGVGLGIPHVPIPDAYPQQPVALPLTLRLGGVR